MEDYNLLHKFYREHTMVSGKMLDNTMRQYVRKSAIAEDPQGLGSACWMGVDWLRLEGIINLMYKHRELEQEHERVVEQYIERLAKQKARCDKLRKLCRENNIDISNV